MQTVTAEVDGVPHRWQERRLLGQSVTAAHAAPPALQERLASPASFGAPSDATAGQARLTERIQGEAALTAIRGEFRVQGLWHVSISEPEPVQSVRASRGRWRAERREIIFTVVVKRDDEAITEAISHLGWRVSAPNEGSEHLSLEQAVAVSRDDSLGERTFNRLKGHPLSLAPLAGPRDGHRIGLVRLLTLAVRALTVWEGGVRRRLAESQEERIGLFAGHPKRRTAQPTAERVREAFCNLTV